MRRLMAISVIYGLGFVSGLVAAYIGAVLLLMPKPGISRPKP